MPTAVHIPSRLSELTNDLSLSGVSAGDLASATDLTKGPALIGWKALNPQGTGYATGAVARTAQDKLNEIPLSVKDFGAVGNGITDDTAAIQAAIDHCLTLVPGNGRLSLKFNRGEVYIISHPLMIARKNTGGTDYSFVTLTLESEGYGYASVPNEQPTIYLTDKTLPAMAIQFGRSVVVRGLTFVGQNTAPESVWSGTTPLTSPMLASGVANGQFNPHAAIVTDPFSADIPDDGSRYPGLNSWYIGSSTTSGSSRTLIEGCFFYRFAVGVVISLGHQVQGDDYQIRNTYAYACDCLYAVSCTQTRGGQFWDVSGAFARYYLTNYLYGYGAGELPTVYGGQISQIERIFAISYLDWGGFSCYGLYCEDTRSIGHFMSGQHYPVVLGGCQFNLAGYSGATTVDYHLEVDAIVNLIGTTIHTDNEPIRFLCNPTSARGMVTASGCIFLQSGSSTPVQMVLSCPNKFRFQDCQIGAGLNPLGQNVVLNSATDANRLPVTPGGEIQTRHHDAVYRCGLWDFQGDYAVVNYGASHTLDGSGRPVFPISNANGLAQVKVGDVLVCPHDSAWNFQAVAGTDIPAYGGYSGVVYAVDSGAMTVTLTMVPKSMLTGEHGYLYSYSWPLFHTRTYGSVTNATNTIANVSNPGAWSVGDRIRARHPVTGEMIVQSGTSITDITGSTFTLSGIARRDAGGYGTVTAELFDAEWQEVASPTRFGGGYHVRKIPSPVINAVYADGAGGSTSYTYYIVAIDRYGGRSLPGPAYVYTGGPVTLSGTDRNVIQWEGVPGSVSYDILRGDTSHFVGNVAVEYLPHSNGTFHDGVVTPSAYTPPGADETALLQVDGRVVAAGGLVTGRNTVPADAELVAGQSAIWLDATNGAGKLMVKARTADGTVVSGSLTLT